MAKKLKETFSKCMYRQLIFMTAEKKTTILNNKDTMQIRSSSKQWINENAKARITGKDAKKDLKWHIKIQVIFINRRN